MTCPYLEALAEIYYEDGKIPQDVFMKSVGDKNGGKTSIEYRKAGTESSLR